MSREQILASVRRSLAEAPPTSSARPSAVDRGSVGTIAAAPADLASMLADKLEARSATVIMLASAQDVPRAVVDVVRASGASPRLRYGADARVARLPWTQAPEVELLGGEATDADHAAISHAEFAIADTGSVAIASGATTPVSLALLPDTHVVLVAAADIAATLEDGLVRIDALRDGGTMPRSLMLVSAPSRTGDIGGKIVLGAHGPRALVVVIYGDA